MRSLLLLLLACLSYALLSSAVNHQIMVGPGGTLTFSPNQLQINAGDTVTFNKSSESSRLFVWIIVYLPSPSSQMEVCTTSTRRTTLSSARLTVLLRELILAMETATLPLLSGLRCLFFLLTTTILARFSSDYHFPK